MFAAAISDYILRQNLNKSMKMIDLASIQMSEILDYKLSSFFFTKLYDRSYNASANQVPVKQKLVSIVSENDTYTCRKLHN